MANMRLNNITLDRLRDRQSLLSSFDEFRDYAEANVNMQGMETNTKKAFDVLTSSKLVEALDLDSSNAARAQNKPRGTLALDAREFRVYHRDFCTPISEREKGREKELDRWLAPT